MGGRLELDEVVTGLMKLRGPVSKTAPRKNLYRRASTFHCVTSHVISIAMYPATVEAPQEASARQLFEKTFRLLAPLGHLRHCLVLYG